MAKQIPSRHPSLRLASDLEQCEASLVDKTNSLQGNFAAVKKDLRSLRKEFSQAKDSRDLPKLRTLAEKRDLLKLKVDALETEVEQFRAGQRKKLDLLDRVIHEQNERMHGLLAYGMATGGLSRDAELLFNTLGDFLQAESDSDRASHEKAVNLILQHGDVFGDKDRKADDIDDRILVELDGIRDPEEATAFYKKHRDEIHRGLDARKNKP